MKKRFSTMQRSGVLKRIFTCVIALALAMPMTVQTGWAATTSYTVTVADGYLALRNAKAYDDKNEIGKLYTGDTVDVTDSSGSTYWYVYASRLKKSGYVNRRYLANSSSERYVSVKSGYLALRNAKAYDDANEIGQLNTGDTVQVQDSSGSTYWYVYSSRLGKSGYVNKNYLQ